MRSVIVTAHDYGDLKLVHTARRLYQRSATSMSTKDKQDLARRFSEAYKLLKDRYKDTGFPEDVKSVLAKVRKRNVFLFCIDQHAINNSHSFPTRNQIKDYQDALDQWGLRDYQLQHTHLQLSYSKMLYIFLHGLVVLSLASIPSLILNFPVGVAANYWAYREGKSAKKVFKLKQ